MCGAENIGGFFFSLRGGRKTISLETLWEEGLKKRKVEICTTVATQPRQLHYSTQFTKRKSKRLRGYSVYNKEQPACLDSAEITRVKTK